MPRLQAAALLGLVSLLASAGPADAAKPRATEQKASTKKGGDRAASVPAREGKGEDSRNKGREDKDRKRKAKRKGKTGPGAARPAKAGARRTPAARRVKTARSLDALRRRRGRSAPAPKRFRETSLPRLARVIRCPGDMVAVAGQVCVDRHESSLVDASSGAALSPYFPPEGPLALKLFSAWREARESARKDSLAHLLEVPPLLPVPLSPLASAEQAFAERAPTEYAPSPRAVSEASVVPSGYVSGRLAARACAAAGKRLCSSAEWVTACRGEETRDFPYGRAYEPGACNVYRETHPAYLLHGSSSIHHDDPRLNLVASSEGPLLRRTGGTPSCASRWGDDAIYDMVGNLDEWIDDPGGTFVGGFYSRGTRSGCDARVSSHPFGYFDYSTGVRCCKDPEPAPDEG